MCYFMIYSYVFNSVLQIIFIDFKHFLGTMTSWQTYKLSEGGLYKWPLRKEY